MNRTMPKLYKQILNQGQFSKEYDAKLELNTRVQKQLDEVEALKAQGLSLKEIGTESKEGGGTVLDFLKEHDRKQREKSEVKKVIRYNESKVDEMHRELYGEPG